MIEIKQEYVVVSPLLPQSNAVQVIDAVPICYGDSINAINKKMRGKNCSKEDRRRLEAITADDYFQ